MQLILEIILEREVRLDGLPQTEKEERDSPRYRHVRLDVWARDLDNRIYDTEVQKRNTGSLPRRSRYYQSHIDVKLLEPGRWISVSWAMSSDSHRPLRPDRRRLLPVHVSHVLHGKQRTDPGRRRGTDFS